jgi:hypothetical protein
MIDLRDCFRPSVHWSLHCTLGGVRRVKTSWILPRLAFSAPLRRRGCRDYQIHADGTSTVSGLHRMPTSHHTIAVCIF